MEICGDNRFKIIAKAKEYLLKATNIDTSEDEMKVLDTFLFRCWQMGWLDRYDSKTEPQKWETPPKFEHKGIITTCVSVPACLLEIEDKPYINFVRCKECRHWSYGKDICNLHDMGMMAEDYCSYGERE